MELMRRLLKRSTLLSLRTNALFDMEEKFQELRMYEDSVNAYRDIVNAIKTAEKRKNGRLVD